MAGGWRFAIVAVGALVLAIAPAVAAPAATAPIELKGTQTVVDEAKGKYEMHGALVGAWNTTTFTERYAGTDGAFVATGTEVFRGCLDADRDGSCTDGETAGALRFSFVYWANYNPKTKALVRGACVHPVIGGTGGFAHATGVVHMRDTPTANGVRTTYTGELDLGEGAAPTTKATREPAGRAPRGMCGSGG
jgi:hypothetical protein